MNRHICIHGHFYQPPRENAWLEDIELQDSAYPYHDWNERITAEGYAPNAAARILGPEGRIIAIVNNYSKISFNFGPTLLSWMEREKPRVYQSILEADKLSQQNFSGHGSALAQVYNHMIMPLANERDKRTQVVWGIRDFEARFGRYPEGMWLPETAVDMASLEILAEHDIKFTILAPHQAARVRKIGEKKWEDVSGTKIDPKMPYLCNLPSGKTITLFMYDGPISQELGFGDLLRNGETFGKRLMQGFRENDGQPQLVHIATDGETYGHHKPHGDMALAYCLYHIESEKLAEITIYGAYLEKNPPTHEVEIFEDTSWSCFHGIERWRSNCGCNSGRRDWQQEWRAPLRAALDWLREALIPIYEKQMQQFVADPWRLRNEYLAVVLNREVGFVQQFLNERTGRELSADEQCTMLKLLEMQRHAMLMYTSCGWFFDEISGIETTQVMQYAGRALQLAEDISDISLESDFVERLGKAPSNIPELQDGGRVYNRFVKPTRLDLLRVGGHYAVSSVFEEYPQSIKIYCYMAESESYERLKAGKLSMALGQTVISSDITWDTTDITFAVIHLGGHILNGGVREFVSDEQFARTKQAIKEAFTKSDIPEVIRLMDDHFGTHNYNLWHLFKDTRRSVFNEILEASMTAIEFHYRQIYESDYSILQAMRDMQLPLPNALITPLEFVLNADLKKILENDQIDLESLRLVIHEFTKWSVNPDNPLVSFMASKRIKKQMSMLFDNPMNVDLIGKIQDGIRLLNELPLQLDFWEAQNRFFYIGKKHYGQMREKSQAGDQAAQEWVEQFDRLGDFLQVKIS